MKEKVVIITGGGKGIGRGVAEAFGEEGANLVITGRHQESLDQAKQELENEFGIQVLAIQADGAVESDVKKVIEQTVQAFGHIDVLINNAMASRSGKLLNIQKKILLYQLIQAYMQHSSICEKLIHT